MARDAHDNYRMVEAEDSPYDGQIHGTYRGYKNRFLLQYKSGAESWHRFRRLVAKVESYEGELFPRVGFIWGDSISRQIRKGSRGAT